LITDFRACTQLELQLNVHSLEALERIHPVKLKTKI